MLLTIYKIFTSEWPFHSTKAFFASNTALPAGRLGTHNKLGRDTARTVDPKWPKRYSELYGVMFNVRAGRSRSRAQSEWWHLSDPVPVTWDTALLSWGWLNSCQPTEVLKGSLVLLCLCALLLLYPSNCLNLKVSLPQPMNFLTSILLLLSPIPLVGSEWLPGVQPGVLVKPWLYMRH